MNANEYGRISFSGLSLQTSLSSCLHLNSKSLTDSELIGRYSNLIRDDTVTRLHCDFSNNCITRAGIPDVEGSYIANGVISDIYQALSCAYHVDLDINCLGDEGALAISKILLSQCHPREAEPGYRCTALYNLGSLSLKYNGITDEGAMHILEALKSNKNIVRCDLGDNKISGPVVKAIIEILGRNRSKAGLLLSLIVDIKLTTKVNLEAHINSKICCLGGKLLNNQEIFDFCHNINQRLNPIIRYLREAAYAKVFLSSQVSGLQESAFTCLVKLYELQGLMDEAVIELKGPDFVYKDWLYYISSNKSRINSVLEEIEALNPNTKSIK